MLSHAGLRQAGRHCISFKHRDKVPQASLLHAQVWSVVALPDSSGFLSASADHDVKFWEWELRTDAAAGSAQRWGARLHAPCARSCKS